MVLCRASSASACTVRNTNALPLVKVPCTDNKNTCQCTFCSEMGIFVHETHIFCNLHENSWARAWSCTGIKSILHKTPVLQSCSSGTFWHRITSIHLTWEVYTSVIPYFFQIYPLSLIFSQLFFFSIHVCIFVPYMYTIVDPFIREHDFIVKACKHCMHPYKYA
jgi:hypothetical protein